MFCFLCKVCSPCMKKTTLQSHVWVCFCVVFVCGPTFRADKTTVLKAQQQQSKKQPWQTTTGTSQLSSGLEGQRGQGALQEHSQSRLHGSRWWLSQSHCLTEFYGKKQNPIVALHLKSTKNWQLTQWKDQVILELTRFKLHIDYKTGGRNLSSALSALTSPARPPVLCTSRERWNLKTLKWTTGVLESL